MFREEKAICQDTSSHPSSGTSSRASIVSELWEKCQSDAVSHRTNHWQ
jgi:hypothetical protein